MGRVRKVYLVEVGEYSDYRVMKVCATKALADQYADHVPGSSVAEETLLTELPELLTYLSCTVSMLESGECFGPKEEQEQVWADSGHGLLPVRVRIVNGYRPSDNYPRHLQITVHGTDVPRVRKVMSETLARCKAEIGIWLTEDYLAWDAANEINQELTGG